MTSGWRRRKLRKSFHFLLQSALASSNFIQNLWLAVILALLPFLDLGKKTVLVGTPEHGDEQFSGFSTRHVGVAGRNRGGFNSYGTIDGGHMSVHQLFRCPPQQQTFAPYPNILEGCLPLCSGANRSINFICVAQVCTLGRNIGAILFMDGRRVRNSPLNELYTSNPV